MSIQIRYYTKSGNTRKIAEAAASALEMKAWDLSNPLLEMADPLVLCSSYYAFDADPAVKEFIRSNRNKIGSVVCMGTSAGMKDIRKPIEKVCKELGIPVQEDFFHCYGSFGPFHKGKPDSQDLARAGAFAAGITKTIR